MRPASLPEQAEQISKSLRLLRRRKKARGKIKSFIDWTADGGILSEVLRADWVRHLADRKDPQPIDQLFPLCQDDSPLMWAAPTEIVGSDSVELVQQFLHYSHLGTSQRLEGIGEDLENWQVDSKDRSVSIGLALECLAMSHVLPKLATQLEPEIWWNLLHSLAVAATDASGLSLKQEPLEKQLLAGELALTLAYLFPEIKFRESLRKQGRETVAESLLELLDGAGLPHACELDHWRPLLASWTRSLVIAKSLYKHPVPRRAQDQYDWSVCQGLRCTRADGSQTLLERQGGQWPVELLREALRITGDPADAVAAMAQQSLKKPGGSHVGDDEPLPEPSVHSEWSEFSVLRTGWRRKDARFSIAHADKQVRTELENGGNVLWSGLTNPEIRINDQLIHPCDGWEVVCWFSDADGDYLEIETKYDAGWKVQRQYFLARADQFLYMADVLLGTQPANIVYRLGLPVSNGIDFMVREETREGYLGTSLKKMDALCLPLALPEWRNDHRVGSLCCVEGTLELTQTVRAQNLYAPWFFDLSKRRLGRALTWRQLTVGEDLQNVSSECAVGYRVQVGKKQWLFYRSLTQRCNRTVLGQNLSSECLIAGFRRDGTYTSLVEIE